MESWQWLLELCLVGLLGTTLFYALRLERALGVLKRDRTSLEAVFGEFNASFRQAETGIERLRAVAGDAGQQVARQIEAGKMVQCDLARLVERAERLADRLEQCVRATRAPVEPPSFEPVGEPGGLKLRSQAERDLLKALRLEKLAR